MFYLNVSFEKERRNMFGLLSVLFFGISDEIRIRKDIKNDLAESAKRCADFKRRMDQWEELRKKDYRR